MDFNKFSDIILKKHIYLRRIDKFEDPYEGYTSEQFKKALDQSYNALNVMGTDTRSAQENHLRAQRLLPAYSYASCWYLDEFESEEMWKIYGKDKNSIAICTTVGSLYDSIAGITDDYNFYFGKIDYLEKQEISSNWLKVAFRKNANFDFEKEFRVLGVMGKGIANLTFPYFNKLPKIDEINNPLGIHVGLDVQSLIQQIYLSPNADADFKSSVEEILNVSGYGNIECRLSSLR